MDDSDDYQIAVRAAMQMAERFGEDVAIMDNLSVLLLREVDSPCIEIIRCPADKTLTYLRKKRLGLINRFPNFSAKPEKRALRKKSTGAKLG